MIYKYITPKEPILLEQYKKDKTSIKQIAANLNRHISTIYGEFKRNLNCKIKRERKTKNKNIVLNSNLEQERSNTMHRYLTIYQLITIQEYNKNYKYSIRKIAKEIDSNKSTVQRTLILLNQNLTPLQILEQKEINKHKSGRKNIILNSGYKH